MSAEADGGLDLARLLLETARCDASKGWSKR